MPIMKPRPAFLVTHKTAMARQTHHQFVPGLGYIAHEGPPDLPPELNGKLNCDPPAGTPDGSMHWMKPPNSAPPIAMRWVAAERAWAAVNRNKGNRLAWPTSHLQKAGWEYGGSGSPPRPQRVVPVQGAQGGPREGSMPTVTVR